MTNSELISWLLEGDVSIQYQTTRDLLDKNDLSLQKRISNEGVGAKFLACRNENGHWGKSFYQPKWISSHYTLLDLKNLGIHPENELIKRTLALIFETEKGKDGGINPCDSLGHSDVCVNGMVLNYACYFKVKSAHLTSIIDFILSQKMPDGGYNCNSTNHNTIHSSMHTTLSVLEGFLEYKLNKYTYRIKEIEESTKHAQEFLLQHKLFRSDRTGEIINDNFLKLYNPQRWFYDIMKAMDYFQKAKVKYDDRMSEAIDIILSKRRKDGRWKAAPKHSGLTHFNMEPPREPSRWNTLRALRVMNFYRIES